jgi:hypothetical protein
MYAATTTDRHDGARQRRLPLLDAPETANTRDFQVSAPWPPCHAQSVPSYLVESYGAATPAVVDDARLRARRTAELGAGVRYLRTTFIPGDETILHLFEAPSVSVLDEAGRRAALSFERIVEAVEGSAEPRKEET